MGRFKVICIGTAVGAFAHFLLVYVEALSITSPLLRTTCPLPILTFRVPAIPQIIAKPDASLGLFFVSIITLAFAAGFIKPSLGPLLCDQSPVKKPTLKVLPPKKGETVGETVIVDPGVTVSRWLLIFYWCINVGAFFASRYSHMLTAISALTLQSPPPTRPALSDSGSLTFCPVFCT